MAGGHVRKDLGAVMYAPNVLGSRGPRKMQAAIPTISEEPSAAARGRSSSGAAGDDSILARMKVRACVRGRVGGWGTREVEI